MPQPENPPEEFDAYYKWLAIPPSEQPANHYRLLGVQLFEDNPDVIDSAADARLNHLRTFQTGPRGEISQKISNEVSLARVCLLNAEKRARYDSQLRDEIAAKEKALTPPSLPPINVAQPPKIAPSQSDEKSHAGKTLNGTGGTATALADNRTKILIATAICATVLLFVGGAIILFAISATAKSDPIDVAQKDHDVDTPPKELSATDNSGTKNSSNQTTTKKQSSDSDSQTAPTNVEDESVDSKSDSTSSQSKSDSANSNTKSTTGGESESTDSEPTDSASVSMPDNSTPGTSTPNTSTSDEPTPDTLGNPTPDDPKPSVSDAKSSDAKSSDAEPNGLRTDVFDLTSNINTPITPPEVELANSAELFEVYETEFVKHNAIYRAAVAKLSKQATDAIQEIADQSGDQTQENAESIVELLSAEDPSRLTMKLPDSSPLEKVVSKFNSELATHRKSFADAQKPITDDYLDGINKISRDMKRKRKNEHWNYLRNYIRLMEARTDQKPISGQFVYFTNGGLNQAVYFNGERLKFNRFVSGAVRLKLDDIVAISYSSSQRNNAVNLTFISSDKKLYVPILRKHVKEMDGSTNPESITHEMIVNRIGSLEEGRIDPALSQLHLNLGLPLENQGGSQWFGGNKRAVETFGISLSPDMLRSVPMDLSGLPPPDLEQLGEIRKLEWEQKKGLLLISGSQSESRDELPVFEQACKTYGLPYATVDSFNKNLADYSRVHTIVCGSNEMRYWSGSEARNDEGAMKFIDKFVDDGGHLFMFGSFNGDGMEPLDQFGIQVGSQQAQKFELAGSGSALFFYGNRRLLPRNQEVRSVGDFKCSVPHVPLLLRDNTYDPKGLMIATLEHGKGRVTLALIEPSYRNCMWIVPPAFSWIARGSPIPVSEIREGILVGEVEE